MSIEQQRPLVRTDSRLDQTSRLTEHEKTEQLAAKIENIVRDCELNLALGGYLNQLIVPGMVRQHQLTQAQADRIDRASQETMEQFVSTTLTPEQRVAARAEADRERRRGRVPDFERPA